MGSQDRSLDSLVTVAGPGVTGQACQEEGPERGEGPGGGLGGGLGGEADRVKESWV